jgi:hypothetical protein
VGKILAAMYDLEFDPAPAFLDKERRPVTWSAEPFFGKTPSPGRAFPEAETFHFGAFNWYDFSSLPKDRPLHVCYGHWCRYELYRNWVSEIREHWLRIPAERFVSTDPDAVYLHARRTDFVPCKAQPIDTAVQSSAATLAGFAQCLSHFPAAKKLVVVTDDPKDPFHAGFATLGLPYEIVSNAWDLDFLTLASCKNLIMSPSTFSWWAGFLGRAEKIICPIDAGSIWDRGRGARGPDREEYPNLYVDDEPDRWTFLPIGAATERPQILSSPLD